MVHFCSRKIAQGLLSSQDNSAAHQSDESKTAALANVGDNPHQYMQLNKKDEEEQRDALIRWMLGELIPSVVPLVPSWLMD